MVMLDYVGPGRVLGSRPVVGSWVIWLVVGWIGGWLGFLLPFGTAG
jgi:hypothetical protein